MIKELEIKNFKCWKDTGTIKLGPLTVLFGSNSSGKSSIEQFLMMLKQSIESADQQSVFITGSENTSVDLGQPSDILFDQNLKSIIEFHYKWDMEKPITFSNKISNSGYIADEIKFEGQVKVSDTSAPVFEVPLINYELYNKQKKIMNVGLKRDEKKLQGQRAYKLFSSNTYSLVRITGRAWSIPAPIGFYGFPDEAVAYYQNTDFLKLLNLANQNVFHNLYYLGPLRTRARRLYTWNGRNPISVGDQGENTIEAILSADNNDRKINIGYRARRKKFKVIIAECLKKMDLIDEFSLKQISDKRHDYEVKVRTKGSKFFVDIPDVGVGVSQVLPVLVELFYAPPRSTIQCHLVNQFQIKIQWFSFRESHCFFSSKT